MEAALHRQGARSGEGLAAAGRAFQGKEDLTGRRGSSRTLRGGGEEPAGQPGCKAVSSRGGQSPQTTGRSLRKTAALESEFPARVIKFPRNPSC